MDQQILTETQNSGFEFPSETRGMAGGIKIRTWHESCNAILQLEHTEDESALYRT